MPGSISHNSLQKAHVACAVAAVFLMAFGLAVPALAGSPADSSASHITYKVASDLDAAVMPPVLTRYDNKTNSFSVVPYTATLYNGTKITVGGSQPAGPGGGSSPAFGGYLYTRPYQGGYMTANGCQPKTYCSGTKARAQISFAITPSIIPSGNWLEGTINLEGQDTTYSGVDYAMRAAHVMYRDGSQGLVADFWQDCEGIYNYNKVCGPGLGWAHELYAFILQIYGLPSGQNIWLMIDTSTSGVIKWSYSYDGSTWTQYASYKPPSTFIPAVYLGTVSSIYAPPYFTAFYYQFGVWAQTTFKGTFDVFINYPAYYRNSAWTSIPTAYSMGGGGSFYDEDWKYTSNGWSTVSETHPNPSASIMFYSGSSSLPDNTCLWGC